MYACMYIYICMYVHLIYEYVYLHIMYIRTCVYAYISYTQHTQLVSVATCYREQGDWWRAIECSTECLQAIKANAPAGEGLRYSDPSLASTALHQMATCFERVGSYARALTCYAEVSPIELGASKREREQQSALCPRRVRLYHAAT